MPPKTDKPSQIDANHIYLYSIIVAHGNTIDFKKVAALNGLEVPAARMRFTRLLPKLQSALPDTFNQVTDATGKVDARNGDKDSAESIPHGAEDGDGEKKPVAKKRGRPPKEPKGEGEEGVKVKRPRGRPPKVKDDGAGGGEMKPNKVRKRKSEKGERDGNEENDGNGDEKGDELNSEDDA